MLDTYTGREEETLQQLRIYPMKTLALEEKLPDETFEEYDPDSMLIKVNFWRAGLEALTDEILQPIEIKVQKNMAMSALMARLAEENNSRTQGDWKENEVRILKRNPLLNTSHLEVLSDQPAKLLT